MKMITLTMALESGRVTPDTPIYCENGLFRRPGRKPIHDVHHYGTLDAAHVSDQVVQHRHRQDLDRLRPATAL